VGDAGLTTPAPRWSVSVRRLAALAVATAVWATNFAVLARCASWIPFAFTGVALVAADIWVGAIPRRAVRLSGAAVATGIAVGLMMVAFTHFAYARLADLVPGMTNATASLLALLNVSGFSPLPRAGLVVVIATCEEVLFRGPLSPASGAPGRAGFRGLARADVARIVAAAAVYALATATLGSPLLVLCALLCGVAWGTIRLLTGSLLAPVIAHVVWDLGVLIIWPLAAS
jgi:hypothetical protein